jgi:Fe-S-cluster containining protein
MSTARACGTCSLCCTVLRVDELRKLGGTACVHQREGGGCGVHATRPQICRAYQCLWLRGTLRDEDRPDRLGAVLDVVTQGASPWLEIREASPGAFDRSARLREIADSYRRSMPVRIGDVADVLDPARRFRVLLPDGAERVVEGEWTTLRRPGEPDTTLRLPPLERWLRRVGLYFRRRRVAGYRGAGFTGTGTPP